MNLFDVIGPVMVGPSSSHTAGAVKIGYISRKLLGESVKQAHIMFHGSFAATGKGHGTDRAIVAGLMEMKPDDIRIPESFKYAEEKGMKIKFGETKLMNTGPNAVKLILIGISERVLEIIAESLGGGRIMISSINGFSANFTGDFPTLIVHHLDQPGHVSDVTSMLAHKSVNIATMQLYRESRGGNAVMIIECDNEVPKDSIKWLEHVEGVNKVTYLSLV